MYMKDEYFRPSAFISKQSLFLTEITDIVLFCCMILTDSKTIV